MPTTAMITAGLGSALSAGASLYGSSKQADAAANSLALQKQMFDQGQARIDQSRNDMKPFLTTGQGAVYSLAQLYGLSTPNGAGGDAFNDNALAAFRRSPDYDWRMKEGMRALDFSDSAKGLLGSRNHLNNTVSFGQGLASQGLGDYTSRLLALSNIGAGAAGTGLSAALGQGGQAITAGSNMGNAIQGQGQAQAAGVIGAGNAINSGVGGTVNNLMLYNALAGKGAYGGGDYAAFGGVSPSNGGYWGGSSSNPLPGLDKLDYGAGY